MKQSKKKQYLQESRPEQIELIPQRISLKPQISATGITKELIAAGIPVISDTSRLPGVVRFDTPHLSHHNRVDNFMVAQLPLIIQEEIKDLIERKFPFYKGEGKGITLFSGQLPTDNIFFNRIENITRTDYLPELLITTDINSLYYRPDIINDKTFETFQYTTHPAFAGTGLVKSGSVMRYLAADALVIVADKNRYKQTSFPREWYELLHPALEKNIIFLSDNDFFCHTLRVHFVRDFGVSALHQLDRNTSGKMHPTDMIRLLQSGNKDGAKIYIMPYSYARMIEEYIDYQVIWPEDGAIILPIQLLVKKGCFEKHKHLINLLTGAEAGRLFLLNGLIPVNKNVDFDMKEKRLNWLGWDFIKSGDLFDLKKEIAAYSF